MTARLSVRVVCLHCGLSFFSADGVPAERKDDRDRAAQYHRAVAESGYPSNCSSPTKYHVSPVVWSEWKP